MKGPFFLTLALIFFSVLGRASCPSESDKFFFQSLKESQSVYNFRVKMFSDFFGKNLFDEEALYVFYEKDGLQSLFIFDADEKLAKVYRLPRISSLPWLNPERYIRERKSALTRDELVDFCHQSVALDSNVLTELKELEMEKHLYISNENLNCKYLNSSEFNHVIIGFSQQRGERKYFYFKKFGDFEKEKPKEFDAYTKSFDIIENIDKKVVLTGCR